MNNRTICIIRSRRAILTALILAVLAAGCSGGNDVLDNTPPPTDATWSTRVTDLRGQNNNVFVFRCPSSGTARSIWGTDTYTDDSSICTAAVHAGKIDLAQGGVIRVRILPGQSSYRASTRNGIASRSWGSWVGSFMID